MMAPTFPPHAGMAPGHPGMPHGHPMAGMQHPGAGHMGVQPGPGMMQGMHPGVSGPQVTQGPMVTGMPPGAGTPAPGPMHNGTMAMAHLGPQQAMFQQQHPQMNFGQMPMTPQQQQMLARQRMMQQMQQQQQQGMPMGLPNGPSFNQAQLAQMKMGMGMHPQMQMNPNNPQVQNFQHQQQQHQQRLMQAQQAQAAHHAAQMAAAQNQRAANQQMQMTRSQERHTQTPVSQPTPIPQTQAPQQPVPTSQPQPQPSQPKPQQPQAQPGGNQQQTQPASQPVKTSEPEEEPTVKQQHDVAAPMLVPEVAKPDTMMGGQCILQLIMYQDTLAAPDRPHDLDYWEQIIGRYFSPFGSIRQQLFSNKNGVDKSFQLQYPSLARYYHTHFASGVKQLLLQSYDHNQNKLPNGGVHIWSSNASLTYIFGNDIRVTTTGQLRVIFDDMQKIEHLNISTSGWQEYIPRNALTQPPSPETKQSPKINKNVKRAQGKAAALSTQLIIPSSGVGEWGVPNHIFQFLEIAEVMTAMGPLMEYFHSHPGVGIKETMFRVTQENAQAMAQVNSTRMQNHMARTANGQVPYSNAMHPGMNGPTMMNSPGMGHLAVSQTQGSPLMGGPVHTPSPAQNPAAGGVSMMHQMSAQGSNLSGSQGPSTNTSPNVSNKRRRASAVKLEEENAGGEPSGPSKVKPSPKIGGKRQKAAAGAS
ncbi:hypothetical protein A1O3_02544 [Capronia epimyces CBS 606.96]|uniref:LIM interaction domain-containing protein n=1 Tax=Capronia epimyces CBS 606.96 TaxID=1182542 RepID=W9Y9G1_9EURO|nr:uncharacterized protein A1O3_02544 [Capronia epimyces CBS 606.96]EXJ89477.1 hypothetical protein A1O3_02544 [Capronia epimyces CBS 606.96]